MQNRRSHYSAITIESLTNGPDRILSRAEATKNRCFLFVLTQSGSLALVPVETDRQGNLVRMFGSTVFPAERIADLDRALFLAKTMIEAIK
jgi:hypothetical protein